MSMIPGIDEDRWSQGMSSERFHPWYGEGLEPQPAVTEMHGIGTGLAAVITIHGEDGGMTYEQLEPVNGRHHRAKASPPIPYIVRPS